MSSTFKQSSAARRLIFLSLLVTFVAVAVVASNPSLLASSSARAVTGRIARTATRLGGIHKIRHVIVIMQENRSFDSYFGTYPGCRWDTDEARQADGLRARSDEQTVRSPYPRHEQP